MRFLRGEKCKDGWLLTLIHTGFVSNRKEIEEFIKKHNYKILQKDNKLIKAEEIR